MTSIMRPRLMCSINFVHSWIHDLERVIKVKVISAIRDERRSL